MADGGATLRGVTEEGDRRGGVGAKVVAIDGPSASGKSTLARRLARALGFVYVDTGAMYRTFGWWCWTKGLDLADEKRVTSELKRWPQRLVCVDDEVRMLSAGYYPEKEIRATRTSEAASIVAVYPGVRKWMVALQQGCVRHGDLVMEGRDIGTKVFPEAAIKFFVDASPAARAARRGGTNTVTEISARDRRDSQRRGDPLMPSLGAVRMDTSGEGVEESLGRMLGEVWRVWPELKERGRKGEV